MQKAIESKNDQDREEPNADLREPPDHMIYLCGRCGRKDCDDGVDCVIDENEEFPLGYMWRFDQDIPPKGWELVRGPEGASQTGILCKKVEMKTATADPKSTEPPDHPPGGPNSPATGHEPLPSPIPTLEPSDGH